MAHGQTRPEPSVFDQEAPNLEGLPLERLELQENGLSNVSGLEGAEIQELLLQDSHGQIETYIRFQGVIDEMIFI